MGEAESMLCLFCDAQGDETRDLLKYTLDRDDKFCWYAYALYLVRKGPVPGPGKTVAGGVFASGTDICGMCLDLCGNK